MRVGLSGRLLGLAMGSFKRPSRQIGGYGNGAINYSRPYPRQIKGHGFGTLEETSLGSCRVWEVQDWANLLPLAGVHARTGSAGA